MKTTGSWFKSLIAYVSAGLPSKNTNMPSLSSGAGSKSSLPTTNEKGRDRSFHSTQCEIQEYHRYQEAGLAALQRGSAESAVDALRVAVLLQPQSSEAHSNFGRALLAAGYTDAASLVLERAQELSSDRAEGRVMPKVLPPGQETRADFAPGQLLRSSDAKEARYLVRDVFRGGYGIVCVASRVIGVVHGSDHLKLACLPDELGGVCALKTFQARFLSSDREVETFKREAHTWVALGRHPNIVEANAVITIEGLPCVDVEFVPGGSLRRLLQQRGRLPVEEAMKFAIDFCDGMVHANATSVIAHRDIKPENCLLSLDGTLKITDLGLAEALAGGRQSALSGANGLGDAARLYQRIVGTLPYMAPEQFEYGAAPDARTDIHAFGVMLWEMLTGELPRSGCLAPELIEESANSKQLAPSLVALIRRCVSANPKQRPQNFSELKAELTRLTNTTTVQDASANRGATRHEESANRIESSQVEALVRKGSSLITLRRPEEALIALEDALQLDPHQPEAWNNKGNALSDLERLDEALVAYQRALQSYDHVTTDGSDVGRRLVYMMSLATSGRACAWGNMGNALARLGRNEEALEAYNHAIDLDASQAMTLVNKGRLLMRLGDNASALEAVDNALQIDSRLHQALTLKGECLLALNRVEEALVAARQATEIAPQDVDAWRLVVVLLSMSGRAEEAHAALARLIELEPDIGRRLFAKAAEVFEKTGRRSKAFAALDQDLQDVAMWMAWWERGNQLSDEGKLADAVAAFDRALEINPKLAPVLDNKGKALRAMGRIDEAIGAYQTALEIDPRLATAWYRMGNALAAAGRVHEALAAYDHALEVKPDYVEALGNKASVLLRLGRHGEAIVACDRALKISPADRAGLVNKANALALLGRFDEALSVIQSALNVLSNDHDLIAARAAIQAAAQL